MTLEYVAIDVPFEFRHCCWFCFEPANNLIEFPAKKFNVVDCSHPHLIIPSCHECSSLAIEQNHDDVWLCQAHVKQRLMHRYRKHLAIGLHWTEQELAEADFQGGNFESFQRSAWFMYQVAQQRINFNGWPLTIDYQLISENLSDLSFMFDGVNYPSIAEAIAHYADAFSLNQFFVKQLIILLGEKQFSSAIRIARTMVGSTPQERQQMLQELATRN
jgi:hypothetical protein